MHEQNKGNVWIKQGLYVLLSWNFRLGFTFDDQARSLAASSLAEMARIIKKDARNQERIFSYMGGEEINQSPTHSHHRYVIDLAEMTEEEACKWPDLMAIVEARVKPERMRLRNTADGRRLKERWWQFSRTRPELRAALQQVSRTLVIAQTSDTLGFAFKDTSTIFGHTVIVIPFDSSAAFACLQCRIHGVWAEMFGATMKDDSRYMPSDCFETFPFPKDFESNAPLDCAGEEYYDFRAGLMVRNNEGLTATYNRFHDPAEGDVDIHKLRELHDAMDRAVMDAYGWENIQPVCGFGLEYLDVDEENMPVDLDVPEQLWWPTAVEALAFAAKLPKTRRRLPWRYRWPAGTRDEVLARLLELNKQRAEEERRTGVAAAGKRAKKSKRRRKKRPSAPTLIDLGEERDDGQ